MPKLPSLSARTRAKAKALKKMASKPAAKKKAAARANVVRKKTGRKAY